VVLQVACLNGWPLTHRCGNVHLKLYSGSKEIAVYSGTISR
jgi:hypothetical protein